MSLILLLKNWICFGRSFYSVHEVLAHWIYICSQFNISDRRSSAFL